MFVMRFTNQFDIGRTLSKRPIAVSAEEDAYEMSARA